MHGGKEYGEPYPETPGSLTSPASDAWKACAMQSTVVITEPESYPRELAHRENDGIQVSLVWSPDTGDVWVTVLDAQTGESFHIEIDAARALDAFHHPFAYLPAGDAELEELLAA